MFEVITKNFKGSLKKIADENGYGYVIDTNADSSLLFPLPLCDDITPMVIAKPGL